MDVVGFSPSLQLVSACKGFAIRRSEGDSGLRRQKPKGEALLQVQFDGSSGMAEIAKGDVLPETQLEIAPTSRQHKTALDGRSPNDLAIHQLLNMLEAGQPASLAPLTAV